MAASGTPVGSSQCGESPGQFVIGVVKRLLGCAAGAPPFHGTPRQSSRPGGGGSPFFSHHGFPSGASATLVKIVSRWIIAIACGLDSSLVPGTTPKQPASGFTAHSRP